MGLFGRQRDRELIKHVSQEVLQDILDTPVLIYKPHVSRTDTNLYGEGPDGYKRWRNGVKLHAAILREDQEWNTNDFGLDISQNITFSFLNEHIWEANISGSSDEAGFAIDPGDIVLYDSHYWEIDTTNRNQYLLGRNEAVYDSINSELAVDTQGESLSTVATAHLTRRSKLNIEHPKHLKGGVTSGTNEDFQGLYR